MIAYPLLNMRQLPWSPAPLSSEAPGSAWLWGHYIVVFQTRPKTPAHQSHQATGKSPVPLPPFQHPFALTVYYQRRHSPHRASQYRRPILIAALCIKAGSTGITKNLVVPCGDYNIGDFTLPLTEDNARAALFDLIRRNLHGLEGEPTPIGSIADLYGHPLTGWPTQEKFKAAGQGCLVLLAALASLLTTAGIILTLILTH